ncbi:acetyl/propionyl/methylcrotonyl-CoA carboxylase subunit alpha [Desulfosediminicola ganghwensis]|uniref:acetyl/propionyl/methylcrotonyl-CoA carboxylase subunit alpha n=1 Tax=Desulfosediminicola ganghwensis TaxID=2569540 RepID=UPI0010ACEA0C|nr:biotin carboxylase N-terminal domain-containing protein [Desulfosediminicola ganghwensis]
MFNKILVANRGEIACRIIRTASKLGIATVAVYSEADRNSLHTRLADEAFCLGPPPAVQSYLNIGAIIEVAIKSGAEAIHPGYGFLSENPEFARRCVDAGLIFVGPPADVIEAMGIKSRAKELMEQAGIPVIPGGYISAMSKSERSQLAESIGYPLLIKADLGGGGKGIRLVTGTQDLEEAVAAAGREAASAFGDASLLLEKNVTNARHIEVQVFRDSHGNCLHLFERDCSMQRRHQKIVEEAPAPGLEVKVRDGLHQAAVKAADSIGYLGAGTVEFLVSNDDHFFFLEINTRLQVEHPVTEMITGLDLVEWQLLVAAGESLPLLQQEVQCNGHAVEVRIYAEDPERNFMPSSGRIRYLDEPSPTGSLRIDSGITIDNLITPNYDPILVKLISHGPNRDEALKTLVAGMRSYRLAGLTTNLNFLQRLLASETFKAAQHTTRTIDNDLEQSLAIDSVNLETAALAGLYRFLDNRESLRSAVSSTPDPFSPWSGGSCFRLNHENIFHCRFGRGEEILEIEVTEDPLGIQVKIEDTIFCFSDLMLSGQMLQCRQDGRNRTLQCHRDGHHLTLFVDGRTEIFATLTENDWISALSGAADSLRAPIPGNITEIFVADETEVKKGEPILVMEAMKMEYVIRAPADGRVVAVLFAKGDSVQERQRLAQFEAYAETEEESDESS